MCTKVTFFLVDSAMHIVRLDALSLPRCIGNTVHGKDPG